MVMDLWVSNEKGGSVGKAKSSRINGGRADLRSHIQKVLVKDCDEYEYAFGRQSSEVLKRIIYDPVDAMRWLILTKAGSTGFIKLVRAGKKGITVESRFLQFSQEFGKDFERLVGIDFEAIKAKAKSSLIEEIA